MNVLHLLQLMAAFFAGASVGLSGTGSGFAIGYALMAIIAGGAAIAVHFNTPQQSKG